MKPSCPAVKGQQGLKQEEEKKSCDLRVNESLSQGITVRDPTKQSTNYSSFSLTDAETITTAIHLNGFNGSL
ncbi:hypothetical protein NQZ68_013355 [Dissostichus eleginoides]|nr:hypothetical protein NQZ68_013355 [Dissostichus eleginoides]